MPSLAEQIIPIANKTYPKSIAESLNTTPEEWGQLSTTITEAIYKKEKPFSDILSAIIDEVSIYYSENPNPDNKAQLQIIPSLGLLVIGIWNLGTKDLSLSQETTQPEDNGANQLDISLIDLFNFPYPR